MSVRSVVALEDARDALTPDEYLELIAAALATPCEGDLS